MTQKTTDTLAKRIFSGLKNWGKDAIGESGRHVLIKRGTFAKNAINHPDVSAEDSKKILTALYKADKAIKDRPIKSSNYWVIVKVGEDNAVVTIDTSPVKENIEVVS